MIAPPKASLMDRLREETRELHEYAEGRPLPRRLAEGTLPRETYVRWLAQMRLVHRELEAALERLRDRSPAARRIVRREQYQEANLAADLAHHGSRGDDAEDDSIPLAPTAALLETIRSTERTAPLALLGMHYVLEGSKNGARILAKRVAEAYGGDERGGLRYLDPHGREQRRKWASFKESMNDCGFTRREQDAMVEAAKAMFRGVADLGDAVIDSAVGVHTG